MSKKGKNNSENHIKDESEKNQDAVNYAIQKGIESLVEDHPIYGESQDYIISHIDQKGIWNQFNRLYNSEIKEGKSPDIARKTAYNGLQKYIQSGKLLDEKAKKVILEEGIKEKTGFIRKMLHKEVGGEKYLNNALRTFRDLDNLIKSNEEYSQRMPEITEAINTLKDSGFHYAATRILKEGGFIDEKKEKAILRQLYQNAEEQPKKIISGIEKYVMPQKIAAAVIGFIGTFLILFNLNMTGAVIGGDSTITKGIIGIFMIFFALLLYLRPLKTSFKK